MKTCLKIKKPYCIYIFFFFVATVFPSPEAMVFEAQTQDMDLIKHKEMIKISRQLGVTCNYCHDVKNLKKATSPKYKVALEHIRITKLLNEKGFKGSPKVDCFLCHRGVAKPAFKEKSIAR